MSRRTVIVVESADAVAAANLLQSCLRSAVGLELPVVGKDVDGRVGVILFRWSGAKGLGAEGYELHIGSDRVEVVAEGAAGFGWAVQTIRQVLPVEVERAEASAGTWALPAGTVRDMPRFSWRGAMLDVARHFFAPEDVKQVVDLLAAYKMNRLHLHLSDDQGWRLEIEKYPDLTDVGGSTAVGDAPGGYYTQDDYRNLVAYAAERGVIVVPEIEMPGHCNAALASISGLNCDGVARKRYTGTGVGFSSLCVDSELTYRFVDDVIAELAILTPGPYIHIGGDEARSTEPGSYQRFVERALGIVRSHGKTPMGWDDVATVRLGSDAIVQHWRLWIDISAAVRDGARLVISPATLAYLDMKYDPSTPLGLTWAGCINTRRAYEWDPVGCVPHLPAEAVLGVEAPLWTETVTTPAEIEQMMLPRLPGYAELGWSSSEGRSWEEYRERLANHANRWVAAGRTFTEDPLVPWRR